MGCSDADWREYAKEQNAYTKKLLDPMMLQEFLNEEPEYADVVVGKWEEERGIWFLSIKLRPDKEKWYLRITDKMLCCRTKEECLATLWKQITNIPNEEKENTV